MPCDDPTPANVDGRNEPEAIPWHEAQTLPVIRGDYELLQRIGWGPSSVAFRGRRVADGLEVVFKCVHSESSATRLFREKFLQELDAAANLRHPGVVSVIEGGLDDGVPYIVRRYVHGLSLAEVLAIGTVPPRDAARVARDIANALHFAHQKGVVHRNLRPSQVILDYRSDARRRSRAEPLEYGQLVPRITDFASSSADADQRLLFSRNHHSPSRFSFAPEQLDSTVRSLTPSCDIYATGTLLYAMLTGRLPFTSTDGEYLRYQICHEPPVRPRQLDRSIAPALESIVLKCLHKRPSERYASAADLARELDRFLDDDVYMPPQLSRAPSLPNVAWHRALGTLAAMLLGAACLLAATVVTYQSMVSRGREGDGHESGASGRAVGASVEDDAYRSRVSLSMVDLREGGQQLVGRFLDDTPPHQRNWEWGFAKRQFLPATPTLVAQDPSIQRVSLAPDGSLFATWHNSGQLTTWDASSGSIVGSCTIAFQPRSLNWVDPHSIGCGTDDGLFFVCDPFSGDIQQLVSLGESPVTDVVTSSDQGRVFVRDARGSTLAYDPARATWSRCDDRVSSHQRVVAEAHGDGTIVTKNGEGTQTMARWKGHAGPVVALSANERGDRVVSIGVDGQIVLWKVRVACASVNLPRPNPVGTRLAFPPDGSSVAIPDGGSVRFRDVETGATQRLVGNCHDLLHAIAFSKHGQWLIAGGERGIARFWDLNDVEPRGREGSEPGATILDLDFCRGNVPVAVARVDGTVDLVDVTERRPLYRLTAHEGPARCARFTSDGMRLVTGGDDRFVRVWSTKSNVELARLRGHQAPVLAVAPSPDSQTLVSADLLGQLIVWDLARFQPLHTLPAHRGPIRSLAFAPDGKRVVSVGDDQQARLWDPHSGHEIPHILPRLPAPAAAVSFSPAGASLAIACQDRHLQLFHADPW